MVEARAKVVEHRDLPLATGCEVGVSAFRRRRMMVDTVPAQQPFSKASPGSNHGGVAGYRRRRTRARDEEVLCIERRDAIGCRFEVIDERDAIDPEALAQLVGIDLPR